jgi:antitoxin PrlF
MLLFWSRARLSSDILCLSLRHEGSIDSESCGEKVNLARESKQREVEQNGVKAAILTVKELGKMAKPSSTISSKGQITVPREVRRRLGRRPGDRVEFVTENGQTMLRPARDAESPFSKYKGANPAFSNVEEVNAWVRSLRDEDEADGAE